MPEVIETTIFTFDELNGGARERARNWYRQASVDDDWHASEFEDFERVCEILGVRLKTAPIRLFGGGIRQKPCIWFSGFASQGDGACFEGSYSYRKCAAHRIRAYAPDAAALHRIADELLAIQKRNFFQLEAAIRHRGRYYHEQSMEIMVERDGPFAQEPAPEAEDFISEALRDLARWLYRQLEREYEYQMSDEVVDEGIVANGYTFTEVGRRFG